MYVQQLWKRGKKNVKTATLIILLQNRPRKIPCATVRSKNCSILVMYEVSKFKIWDFLFDHSSLKLYLTPKRATLRYLISTTSKLRLFQNWLKSSPTNLWKCNFWYILFFYGWYYQACHYILHSVFFVRPQVNKIRRRKKTQYFRRGLWGKSLSNSSFSFGTSSEHPPQQRRASPPPKNQQTGSPPSTLDGQACSKPPLQSSWTSLGPPLPSITTPTLVTPRLISCPQGVYRSVMHWISWQVVGDCTASWGKWPCVSLLSGRR